MCGSSRDLSLVIRGQVRDPAPLAARAPPQAPRRAISSRSCPSAAVNVNWPRYRWLDPFTITVKSVSAGEKAAEPEQGPMMAAICGDKAGGHDIAEEQLRDPSDGTLPLAPCLSKGPWPQSYSPTTGAPFFFMARSMTFTILPANISPRSPSGTCPSCENT